jgi:uncharacterized delta-60 repeat protein
MNRFALRRIGVALASVGLLGPALLLSPAPAGAVPGQLVATFGPFGNGAKLQPANVAVLVQPDGKVVTVGGFDDAVSVARQSTSGRLDRTFSSDGRAQVLVPPSGAANAAALQPDGKIVIVGSANGHADFFVARLRTDGALDTTFSQDGIVTTDFGGDTVDQAFGVAIAPGGKIVVVGQGGNDGMGIARYNTNGTLDTTFSGDGRLVTRFGGIANAHEVVVQADGKLVVAGVVGELDPSTFVLQRYNANGSVDTTFGVNGRADTDDSPLESGEELVAQGTSFVVGGPIGLSQIGLSRFDTNGDITPSFGAGGTARVSAGAFTRMNDLQVDGAGRLLSIGTSGLSTDFPDVRTFVTIFRFGSNGRRDVSFGCGGRVLTELLGTSANNTYQAATATSGAVAGKSLMVGVIAEHTSSADLPPIDLLLMRYANDAPAAGVGYLLARADGGTSAFGQAPACGSAAGLSVTAPIVGVAMNPTAAGALATASDGGVFVFGFARFFGSMGNTRLDAPVVGIAAAPDGNGYWLVAADGGIFAFGSARFFGSMGGTRLDAPVVGIAAAPDGNGYWLAAADGGIFAFGSARFFGSMGGTRLDAPVVGIAAAPDGNGYWLAADDGGVFAFGSARFRGSMGGTPLARPVIGIAADPDGDGYWLAGEDGGVFAFAAPFAGSTGASPFPPGAPRVTTAIAAAG